MNVRGYVRSRNLPRLPIVVSWMANGLIAALLLRGRSQSRRPDAVVRSGLQRGQADRGDRLNQSDTSFRRGRALCRRGYTTRKGTLGDRVHLTAAKGEIRDRIPVDECEERACFCRQPDHYSASSCMPRSESCLSKMKVDGRSESSSVSGARLPGGPKTAGQWPIHRHSGEVARETEVGFRFREHVASARARGRSKRPQQPLPCVLIQRPRCHLSMDVTPTTIAGARGRSLRRARTHRSTSSRHRTLYSSCRVISGRPPAKQEAQTPPSSRPSRTFEGCRFRITSIQGSLPVHPVFLIVVGILRPRPKRRQDVARADALP